MNKKISIFLPTLRIGGAERMAINLANEMDVRGIDIELVVANYTGKLSKEINENVRVHDLKFNIDLFPLALSFTRLSKYINNRKPHILLSLMKHANITTIFATSYSGQSPNIVLSERNYLSRALEQEPYIKKKLITFLMNSTYAKSDHVIAISEGVATDLKNTIDVGQTDVSVIYNPAISDDIFEKSRESVSHPWFQSDQPPLILAAGRLCKQKDFSTLLKSFAKVKAKRECHLVILGEGEQRKKLEKLSKKLAISDEIYMPGNVNNPYKYMSKSDVFVLSSAWEGFGNVIVEALACGCQIVSTDCPSGPNEILNNGEFGTLVPVGDEVAMASSIVAILDNPIDTGKLVERSKDFKSSNITDKYLDVLDDL